MNNLFPELYTLSNFRKTVEFEPKSWYIIATQHILQSTGSLFEELINIGFLPENIFLGGKIYSTHLSTFDKLKQLGINMFESRYPDEPGYYSKYLESDIKHRWDKLLSVIRDSANIIILDDGGYTLKNAPTHIIGKHSLYGIEQTTSGIKMAKAFERIPVIRLAASAAKTIIEPPIVSEAVNLQLGKFIAENEPENIGVVGYGYIGKAITKEFSKKYPVLVFDIAGDLNELIPNVTYCNTFEELYEKADIIIGATGQDITNLPVMLNATSNKILISVSSGDIEFNELLRVCQPYLIDKFTSALQDLHLVNKKGSHLIIRRGGMVANFTGAPDSSPTPTIQITRGLIFAAIYQILRDAEKLRNGFGPVQLDPSYQSQIVSLWLHDQPQRAKDYSHEILEGFQNIKWVSDNSKGGT